MEDQRCLCPGDKLCKLSRPLGNLRIFHSGPRRGRYGFRAFSEKVACPFSHPQRLANLWRGFAQSEKDSIKDSQPNSTLYLKFKAS